MPTPKIVLVHGALSGGSIWSEVTERLQARGFEVFVPAMPMRSLKGDVDYLAAFLATVQGPVVLAGHSYGGTVISHARFGGDRTAALVFVSAFAADSGESTAELNSRWPGSQLNDQTTVTRACPGGVDIYLKPECFERVYAGGLPAATIARMAAEQRPITAAALNGSFSGEPAWRLRPSRFLISTDDVSLVPEAQHAMAERAKGSIFEVPSSHASPATHSQEVHTFIAQAVTA